MNDGAFVSSWLGDSDGAKVSAIVTVVDSEGVLLLLEEDVTPTAIANTAITITTTAPAYLARFCFHHGSMTSGSACAAMTSSGVDSSTRMASGISNC